MTHQTTDRFRPHGPDPTRVGNEKRLADFWIIEASHLDVALKLATEGQRPAEESEHWGSGPRYTHAQPQSQWRPTEAPLSSLARCGSVVEALDKQQIEDPAPARVKRARTTGQTDSLPARGIALISAVPIIRP